MFVEKWRRREKIKGRKMKIYSGVDIIEINRFSEKLIKKGDSFLEFFLDEQEIETAKQRTQSLAALFAAKEAISKALGTGIWQKKIDWHDFCISHNDLGKPEVELKNEAKVKFEEMHGIDIDISISHEKKYAIAFCVILAEN